MGLVGGEEDLVSVITAEYASDMPIRETASKMSVARSFRANRTLLLSFKTSAESSGSSRISSTIVSRSGSASLKACKSWSSTAGAG